MNEGADGIKHRKRIFNLDKHIWKQQWRRITYSVSDN